MRILSWQHALIIIFSWWLSYHQMMNIIKSHAVSRQFIISSLCIRAAKHFELSMTTGYHWKVSLSAFLQILQQKCRIYAFFVTKMPYLRIFRNKMPYLCIFRNKNAVLKHFCDKNAVFSHFCVKNHYFNKYGEKKKCLLN